VARRAMTMKRKPVRFDDRNELAKRALQARHATGNPKAELPS
jgi:hypothetical protein